MSTRRSRGGSLQAEEPPGQMHAGRRVCSKESQEAVGAEGKGIVLRAHDWPDPVGLQDVRGG